MAATRAQIVSTKDFKILLALIAWRVALSYWLPIISDCDEVFNYWEASHYLQYGYGMQTWEYVPQYAIRSWSYASMHAAVMHAIVTCGFTKLQAWHGMRMILATLTATSEFLLYCALAHGLSPRIAKYTLMISASAPGMYTAASAYLPSSFAMMTHAVAMACLLHSFKLPTAASISPHTGYVWWTGIGALVGWPFAAALGIPYVVE